MDTLRDQINQINTSPKQILIHVGTNDLQKYGEETFREKYEEIIEAVVQKVKNTKVYISALLLGGDEHNYKIHIANKMLDSLCNKYNIGFIQRIDLTCMITNTYRDSKIFLFFSEASEKLCLTYHQEDHLVKGTEMAFHTLIHFCGHSLLCFLMLIIVI